MENEQILEDFLDLLSGESNPDALRSLLTNLPEGSITALSQALQAQQNARPRSTAPKMPAKQELTDFEKTLQEAVGRVFQDCFGKTNLTLTQMTLVAFALNAYGGEGSNFTLTDLYYGQKGGAGASLDQNTLNTVLQYVIDHQVDLKSYLPKAASDLSDEQQKLLMYVYSLEMESDFEKNRDKINRLIRNQNGIPDTTISQNLLDKILGNLNTFQRFSDQAPTFTPENLDEEWITDLVGDVIFGDDKTDAFNAIIAENTLSFITSLANLNTPEAYRLFQAHTSTPQTLDFSSLITSSTVDILAGEAPIEQSLYFCTILNGLLEGRWDIPEQSANTTITTPTIQEKVAPSPASSEVTTAPVLQVAPPSVAQKLKTLLPPVPITYDVEDYQALAETLNRYLPEDGTTTLTADDVQQAMKARPGKAFRESEAYQALETLTNRDDWPIIARASSLFVVRPAQTRAYLETALAEEFSNHTHDVEDSDDIIAQKAVSVVLKMMKAMELRSLAASNPKEKKRYQDYRDTIASSQRFLEGITRLLSEGITDQDMGKIEADFDGKADLIEIFHEAVLTVSRVGLENINLKAEDVQYWQDHQGQRPIVVLSVAHRVPETLRPDHPLSLLKESDVLIEALAYLGAIDTSEIVTTIGQGMETTDLSQEAYEILPETFQGTPLNTGEIKLIAQHIKDKGTFDINNINPVELKDILSALLQNDPDNADDYARLIVSRIATKRLSGNTTQEAAAPQTVVTGPLTHTEAGWVARMALQSLDFGDMPVDQKAAYIAQWFGVDGPYMTTLLKAGANNTSVAQEIDPQNIENFLNAHGLPLYPSLNNIALRKCDVRRLVNTVYNSRLETGQSPIPEGDLATHKLHRDALETLYNDSYQSLCREKSFRNYVNPTFTAYYYASPKDQAYGQSLDTHYVAGLEALYFETGKTRWDLLALVRGQDLVDIEARHRYPEEGKPRIVSDEQYKQIQTQEAQKQARAEKEREEASKGLPIDLRSPEGYATHCLNQLLATLPLAKKQGLLRAAYPGATVSQGNEQIVFACNPLDLGKIEWGDPYGNKPGKIYEDHILGEYNSGVLPPSIARIVNQADWDGQGTPPIIPTQLFQAVLEQAIQNNWPVLQSESYQEISDTVFKAKDINGGQKRSILLVPTSQDGTNYHVFITDDENHIVTCYHYREIAGKKGFVPTMARVIGNQARDTYAENIERYAVIVGALSENNLCCDDQNSITIPDDRSNFSGNLADPNLVPSGTYRVDGRIFRKLPEKIRPEQKATQNPDPVQPINLKAPEKTNSAIPVETLVPSSAPINPDVARWALFKVFCQNSKGPLRKIAQNIDIKKGEVTFQRVWTQQDVSLITRYMGLKERQTTHKNIIEQIGQQITSSHEGGPHDAQCTQAWEKVDPREFLFMSGGPVQRL